MENPRSTRHEFRSGSTGRTVIQTKLLPRITSGVMLVAAFAIHERAVFAEESFQCAPVPSQLEGWWRGEGDGTDLTGNHAGILTGGVNFAGGEVGQSFNFTDVGQYVDITPGFYDKVRDNFTIEFWALPSAERQSTPESNEGIMGLGGQRYAIFATNGEALDPTGTGASNCSSITPRVHS